MEYEGACYHVMSRGVARTHWAADRRAAIRLLARGSDAETVEQIFPHLEVRGLEASIQSGTDPIRLYHHGGWS